MSKRTCPCSEKRTSPDPSCDMCDGHKNDPDTGWGGYTNHFTGKHYNSEQEEKTDIDDFDSDEIDD